jgi:prepilin-type N-terminal cleavage/methylation domain-containing protein
MQPAVPRSATGWCLAFGRSCGRQNWLKPTCQRLTPVRFGPNHVSRSGFTLLELLLTMAVIAAVVAVAIPNMDLLLGDRRLVRAGEQVRIEMTRLRVDSMRQGRVLMLEGLSGGNSLRIKPFVSVADATEAIDQTGSQSALLSGATQGTMTTLGADFVERVIELPTQISVESVGVVSAARSSLIEQATLSDQADGWSRPILFYPDGSTSTAAVVLRHETVGHLKVELRGITGEATVGEVMP